MTHNHPLGAALNAPPLFIAASLMLFAGATVLLFQVPTARETPQDRSAAVCRLNARRRKGKQDEIPFGDPQRNLARDWGCRDFPHGDLNLARDRQTCAD
jgi:hypothetical protein